jgi:hypothetical protein
VILEDPKNEGQKEMPEAEGYPSDEGATRGRLSSRMTTIATYPRVDALWRFLYDNLGKGA